MMPEHDGARPQEPNHVTGTSRPCAAITRRGNNRGTSRRGEDAICPAHGSGHPWRAELFNPGQLGQALIKRFWRKALSDQALLDSDLDVVCGLGPANHRANLARRVYE